MNCNYRTADVLNEFPLLGRTRKIAAFGGAGGFSGARIWRISAADAESEFCLRCWPPEHPSAERLRFIHGVLRHVRNSGLAVVPVPLATARGECFVERGGRLWELTPWMPGVADYHADPQPDKLAAAMGTLAEFHRATASFPAAPAHFSESPGLAERHRLLAEFRGEGWPAFVAAATGSLQSSSELAGRTKRILKDFAVIKGSVLSELGGVLDQRTTIQPCIRDVWHDHLLFTERQVTGLIDFGAMKPDSVAGDVARLLGSLARDDAAAWTAGLQAYESIRPLSPTERRMVGVFDRSTTALAGMNWLRWLLIEGRRFENPARVFERMDEAIGRLENLVAQFAAMPATFGGH